MAASNTFNIVISATDKATAVAKRVNDSIAKMTKPINDVKTSVAAFGKETGLDRVGKGLEKVGNAAGDVARKVASIAPPMAALVGVGSVAGIAALATGWGKAAIEIANTASVIGVSTTDLQRYRGAARVAGLSADAMTGSMQSLGAAFEDASAGRNNFAAGVLSDKGIGIHRLKDGTIDVVRGLNDVAAAASKIKNSQAQKAFLDIFGLGGLQAMIRRGTIDQFVAQFDKLKATMSPQQIAQGEKFNESMIALDASVDKLKNSIGVSLAPAVGKVVDEFTKLADEYGPKIANWIDHVDWDKTAKSIADIGESLGGVKGIALGLAAITFAGPIAGIAGLITKAAALSSILVPLVANPLVAGILGIGYSKGLNEGEGDHRLTQPGDTWGGDAIGDRRRAGAAADPKTAEIMAKLQAMGWSRQQAAGMAANLWTESLYNPAAVGDNGHAYGIGQWHEDRQANFKKRFGIDIRQSTLDQQLQFMNDELRNGTEQRAGNALKLAASAGQAGWLISHLYERPADDAGEAARRANSAAAIDSAVSAPTASPAGGKLEVTIHMPGAPNGARATVHHNGEIMATGQIGHSLLLGPSV
ncbi:phage tail tip lysozyme [Paraburkholderia sp. RL17-383-BIF-A]|uniref:phage tail tip lysozyme n=1 Tax=Paraburkholderia sp. RL17-383-BIF-A TaxID=3031631 RepID=UPI0038BCC1D0